MSRPAYYVLDEKGVPRPATAEEWASMFEDFSRRQIAVDSINAPGLMIGVSTVFLGIDHNFGESSRPVLFETMVFGGEHDQEQRRYCTKAEALAGHAEILRRIRTDYELAILKELSQ